MVPIEKFYGDAENTHQSGAQTAETAAMKATRYTNTTLANTTTFTSLATYKKRQHATGCVS